MPREIMVVFWLPEFSPARPAQAEREDSSFCEVDAALLLVLGQVPKRFVTGQIQNCWNSAIRLRGLVKKRGRLKTRHNFVAILAYAISMMGFYYFCLLEVWSRIDPFLRPA